LCMCEKCVESGLITDDQRKRLEAGEDVLDV
jgi:hypothetical protein